MSTIGKLKDKFERSTGKMTDGPQNIMSSLVRAVVIQLADHIVDPQLPDDSSEGHRTIQAALDAAVAGESIYISPGTYRENLSLSAWTAAVKGQIHVFAEPGKVFIAPTSGKPLDVAGACTGAAIVHFHGVRFVAIDGQVPIDNTPTSGSPEIHLWDCDVEGNTASDATATDAIVSRGSWFETEPTATKSTGLLYVGAAYTPSTPGGAVANIDT